MDKQLNYAYWQFGRGWWGLLDKYIPAIQALDPECDFAPKEKFGLMRLQVFCSPDCENRNAIWDLEQQAEEESGHICEYCGKPGRLRRNRDWILTLCDACDALDGKGVNAVMDEWHRRLMEMEKEL